VVNRGLEADAPPSDISSEVLEAGKFKMKVLADLASGKSLLPGLWDIHLTVT